MMLQEDFSDVTSRLLALHACCRSLRDGDFLAPVTEENRPELDDGEEEYVVSQTIQGWYVRPHRGGMSDHTGGGITWG